jgi:hypothetical protein
LFTNFSEENLDLHVDIGTNAKCGVEGVGTVRFQLELGGSLEVADVLYVPELKKSFLSVSPMEDRGNTITFKDGLILIQLKGSNLESTQVLGNREGNIYKPKAQPSHVLVHVNDVLCELWNWRMGHLHHKSLTPLREIVTGLPEFSVEWKGVCKGCYLGKNAKATFPRSEKSSKGIMDIVDTDVCGLMSIESMIGSS